MLISLAATRTPLPRERVVGVIFPFIFCRTQLVIGVMLDEQPDSAVAIPRRSRC